VGRVPSGHRYLCSGRALASPSAEHPLSGSFGAAFWPRTQGVFIWL